MIVASFWVWRPEEFPHAADYPAMLRILDRSCARQRLEHVVLTDRATFESPLWPDGLKGWPIDDCPVPLMRACTELQARWLEAPGCPETTLFLGADCIVRKRPDYPPIPDVCVTYRSPIDRYPINTGTVLARQRPGVAALFRRIADRCGTAWCDDQRAIRAELEPMPLVHGMYERAGLRVAFLPMRRFNVLPRDAFDPAHAAYVVHFRGKARKQLLFDWAAQHGFSDRGREFLGPPAEGLSA